VICHDRGCKRCFAHGYAPHVDRERASEAQASYLLKHLVAEHGVHERSSVVEDYTPAERNRWHRANHATQNTLHHSPAAPSKPAITFENTEVNVSTKDATALAKEISRRAKRERRHGRTANPDLSGLVKPDYGLDLTAHFRAHKNPVEVLETPTVLCTFHGRTTVVTATVAINDHVFQGQGVAVCAPCDRYDRNFGRGLASARALNALTADVLDHLMSRAGDFHKKG